MQGLIKAFTPAPCDWTGLRRTGDRQRSTATAVAAAAATKWPSGPAPGELRKKYFPLRLSRPSGLTILGEAHNVRSVHGVATAPLGKVSSAASGNSWPFVWAIRYEQVELDLFSAH